MFRPKYTIYCFWTEDNPMSEQRMKCLQQLRDVSGCNVNLVTTRSLHKYIHPKFPLHEAYPYLSAVHKADYLRCYFMHFHGGAYTDVKTPYGWTWYDAFRDFELNPRAMINIRQPGTAMMCRPQTELTKRWYAEVCCVLDKHLPTLQQYPAATPYTCRENDPNYPIGWTEIMINILGPLCEEYAKFGYVMTTVPLLFVHNHR